MKTIETILRTRANLRAELGHYESIKNEYIYGRKWSDFDTEEKREFSHILGVIQKLKVQINALTYVINYDSELDDVTIKPQMVTRGDIND